MASQNETKETKLAFRLDARGLRDMKKEMDKTIDRRMGKDFHATLKELKSTLKDVTREQAALTKAMLDVDAGTKQFEKLENKLKKTEQAAAALRRTIQSISQATHDPRSGAFSQGLLQGLSP